jgi:hypothetical protein
LLLAGSSAYASDEPAPDPTKPTFVTCAGRPSTGRLPAVLPAGDGWLLLVGAATPCRRPSAQDAVAVTSHTPTPALVTQVVHGESEYLRIVRYRSQLAGHFVTSLKVRPSATRVCISDTPDHAVDCVSIKVPTKRNGEAGVPIVGRHTSTAGVTVPRERPFCATCW